MLGLLADAGLLTGGLIAGAGVGYVLCARRRAPAPPEAAAAPVAAASGDPATVAFLAKVSHDIRTPLNGVLAVADVLNRTDLSPQQRRLVAVMLNAGSAVNDVLNGLLALAEPDAAA